MPRVPSPGGGTQPTGNDFVTWVSEQIGKPYVWGGTGPNGFDCSGLVYAAATALGLHNFPRTSEDQWNSPQIAHIDASQLQAGDLIFETFPGEVPPGHVVVWAGNDSIIQAASTGTLVQRDSFTKGDAAALGASVVGFGRILGLNYSNEPSGWNSTGPPVPAPGSGQDSTSTSGDKGPIDVSGPLAMAGAFFHDLAVPIAWALEAFEPGQGVRLAAGTGAVVTTIGGLKAWQAASQNPEGTGLPVAIGLFGATAVLAFITFRPWPQPGGRPVKTGAYLVGVIKGEPPAPGPSARPPVGAVESGLVVIAGLWAASKAAQGISGAVAAGSGIGAAFAKLWKKIAPVARDVGAEGA